ncbi:MAG TPA: hypothetical protein VHN77_05355 [Phycisphaerales bacterium]|nr:hypothetical protein [Phycisphaerales bacterium]
MNYRPLRHALMAILASATSALAQSAIQPTALDQDNRVKAMESRLADLEMLLQQRDLEARASELQLRSLLDKLEAQSTIELPNQAELDELKAKLQEALAALASSTAPKPDPSSRSAPGTQGAGTNKPEPNLSNSSEGPAGNVGRTTRTGMSEAARLMKEADDAMSSLGNDMSMEELTYFVQLNREIHKAGLNWIHARLSAATQPPAEDPLAALKQEVQAAALRREIEKYREIRTELFYTNWIGRIVFLVAHGVLALGLWMAAHEFRAAQAGRRKAEDQAQEIKLSLEGIALKTALHGVVIMAFAMGFYFLYLKFVYPITTVG